MQHSQYLCEILIYKLICIVPEEFLYNPVTRVYGEPHKRPEVQNATIEFMAPSEYMVRLYLLLFILCLCFIFRGKSEKALFQRMLSSSVEQLLP